MTGFSVRNAAGGVLLEASYGRAVFLQPGEDADAFRAAYLRCASGEELIALCRGTVEQVLQSAVRMEPLVAGGDPFAKSPILLTVV